MKSNIFVQTIRDYIVLSWLSFDTQSNSFCCFDFHLISYSLDSMLRNSSEDTWEHQRVVDLVFKVTSSAAVNPSSRSFGIFWKNLWNRIGQSKNNAFICHLGNPVTSQSFFLRNSNEYISSNNNIPKLSLFPLKVCDLSNFSFSVIHSFFSSFVDGSLWITNNHILDSILHQKFSNCDTCRSCSIDKDFAFSHILLNNFDCIDQACQSHNCSSVLIIMKDGCSITIVHSFLNCSNK